MKFRLKMPSPALVVACVALLVALGGTSYAAMTLPKGSVGTKQLKASAVTAAKIKKGTIAATDISPAALTTLKGNVGATGPQGPQGVQGTTGPAGTAVAYGTVNATVTNGIKANSGWTHVDHPSTGIYCLTGFTATLHTVVASVDASTTDPGATAQAMVGFQQCPSTTQVEVQTFDQTGARANEPFDFIVN